MDLDPITIRSFKDEDAACLNKILKSAVETLTKADYSDAQRRAWASLAPSPAAYRDRAGDGRWVRVAVEPGGRILGYAELEPDGHVDQLYCAPEAAGRGIGSRLLADIEAIARTEGLARLYVEASETARPVFEHAGFTWRARRDLVIGGVEMHNHAMQKRL